MDRMCVRREYSTHDTAISVAKHHQEAVAEYNRMNGRWSTKEDSENTEPEPADDGPRVFVSEGWRKRG